MSPSATTSGSAATADSAPTTTQPGNAQPGTARPSSSQLRTVLASSMVGTTVEWYDFFLYGVAATLIFNKQFFPNDDPTVATLLSLATFAIGFVARPVGGLLFGHIGDRLGRKRTLVATMQLMGIATFLIGCLPTYDQVGVWAPLLLIALRIVQGIAIGGEWGGAVLMAVEYAPEGKRGFFGSIPQMGLALGLFLGTGIFALVGALLPADAFNSWGWRTTFWLSIVLVTLGLFIRLRVLETPAFADLEARGQTEAIPAKALIAEPESRRNLLLGMGARWIEGLSFNTWAVFSITYATDYLKLERESVLWCVMAGAAVMFFVIPAAGRLTDRVTPRRLFIAAAALSALAPLVAWPLLGTGEIAWWAVTLMLVLGVLYAGMSAPVGTFFAGLFPVHSRYTGISSVYQISGIYASGLTPVILAALLKAAGGSTRWVIAYAVAVGLLSTWCAWRTRDVAEPELGSSPARVPARELVAG